MNFKSTFILDFGKENNLYYELLKEEDFDFKTKDININIGKNNNNLEIDVVCNCVLDLKIGINALIKSLEIINKTLNV